jgi:pSer/pThr/pTyr-binding forkhead associated (FHA) protein
MVLKDGDTTQVPLDKERIVLGRDKSCDVVLDHESVSRRHAALIFRHGSVYVENVSSTGRVLRGDEAVEYVELEEGHEVKIGPFSLYWQSTSQSQIRDAQREGERREEVSDGGPAAFAPPPREETPAPPEPEEPGIPVLMGEVDNGSGVNSGVPELGAASSPGFQPDESSGDSKTAIVSQQVSPRLRIVKSDGDETGREIRLQGGPQWVVGRSTKAHVQIDHAKFSRQHFKILKIGDTYRVQDLGSANGTRLNGVAVTDAPLQPFDTIQIGPIELQFVLVDQEAEHLAADASLPMASEGFRLENEEGHEKTQFSPPIPYTPGAGGFHTPPDAHDGHRQESPSSAGFSVPHGGSASAAPSGSPLQRKLRAGVEWFQAQPKPRKMLIVVASAALLALALKPGDQTEEDRMPASIEAPAPVAAPSPTLNALNAADPGDVSAEFFALSADKQREIQELYVKAENAQAAKDWNTAFQSTQSILKLVKKYKKSGLILDEAQANLLESKLGSISTSASNVADAAVECAEKTRVLLDSARKAIQESRWSDAEQSSQAVLNQCDPNDKEALRLLSAAIQKDPNALAIEAPTNAVTFQDPDAEARQAEREQLDALKAQYQDARYRMNQGSFREASPILRDLDQRLSERVNEYEAGKRAPASLRADFSGESKALQTQVREALDTVRTQLRSEFQADLADADQHVSNRQYVSAREIYDRILRTVPEFDDAREARERLYDKIIAEARTLYAEAAIYESVGDLENAVDGYTKSKDLLTNVGEPLAIDYYKRSAMKLRRLQR